MREAQEKLLIDIADLSEMTGIAVGSLYHMVSQHRIPCVRLSRRCLRFSLPAIREWLDGLSEPAVTAPSENAFRKKLYQYHRARVCVPPAPRSESEIAATAWKCEVGSGDVALAGRNP
jgi:predicted DNA-binding transcriptional regulator AlpA